MLEIMDETETGSSFSTEESPISFEELGLESTILTAIRQLGFVTPTPIQREVIPLLLKENHDLIGLAQTGTGKTAAFGLPLVQQAQGKAIFPEALILCPTRELCMQISGDLKRFATNKKHIRVLPVYGGAAIRPQSEALHEGVHIVVATPGRMLDLINRGDADLSMVRTLVLDEADEMLNMGFKEELDGILEKTPVNRRTLLFSATMSRDIERIASNFMRDPIEVTIGRRNQGAENVRHVYFLVHEKDRYLALKRIADFHPDIYSIIFCRTRQETQAIADKLAKDGYDADALHGDLSQAQRDFVMQRFRSRRLQMLVATDVAARGLDVEDLTHIINYNLPDDSEQYTHRSGRTGRAGKTGVSVSIINIREQSRIKDLERKIGKRFTQERVPGGREICEKQLFNLIDRMEKVDVYDEEIETFLPAVYTKLQALDREELIKRFVSVEFNYFLDYYKNTPDINVEKYEKGKKRSRYDEDGGFSEIGAEDRMTRFFINLGRKDDLTPPLLIGLVNDISRKLSIRIGRIEIKHSFTFFEADSRFKEMILDSFNRKKFRNREIVAEEAAPAAPVKPSGADQRRGPGKKSGKFAKPLKTGKKAGKKRKERY